MYVSKLKGRVRFVHFRPNDKWPQVSCHIPGLDPNDSDAIDKVP